MYDSWEILKVFHILVDDVWKGMMLRYRAGRGVESALLITMLISRVTNKRTKEI